MMEKADFSHCPGCGSRNVEGLVTIISCFDPANDVVHARAVAAVSCSECREDVQDGLVDQFFDDYAVGYGQPVHVERWDVVPNLIAAAHRAAARYQALLDAVGVEHSANEPYIGTFGV